jgi:ABC-2 type transport system ATP-binding protein
MSDYTIRTDNLTRDFDRVRAVDHLSLDVPRGMVFGFLGPNGAGKTTTIRLLLGLLEPTEGRAEVLGFDAHTQAGEIRLRTGALLEHSGLYERLSAEDNLDFYGRIWHISPTERQARTEELLTHLDLWDRRRELAGSWSRGMRQKLAVARALLHHPLLLFLDEPTAGLDPVAAAALHEDLASLATREGVTVFLTTHHMAEAEKLCHQVGVIRHGRLLAVGSPDELRARQGSPRLEVLGRGFSDTVLDSLRARPEVVRVEQRDGHLAIDLKGTVDTAPLVTLLVNGGVQVDEVHKGSASLEQAFLTLMEEER